MSVITPIPSIPSPATQETAIPSILAIRGCAVVGCVHFEHLTISLDFVTNPPGLPADPSLREDFLRGEIIRVLEHQHHATCAEVHLLVHSLDPEGRQVRNCMRSNVSRGVIEHYAALADSFREEFRDCVVKEYPLHCTPPYCDLPAPLVNGYMLFCMHLEGLDGSSCRACRLRFEVLRGMHRARVDRGYTYLDVAHDILSR